MKKKGLIGAVVLFVILFIVIGLIYWFFFRTDNDGIRESPEVFQLLIISESVFVNNVLHKLIFEAMPESGTEGIIGIRVVIEDENGRSYSKDILETVNGIEPTKTIVDYSESGLGMLKKFSIAPILINQEIDFDGAIYAVHEITENDFKSKSCNKNGEIDPGEVCDDGNLYSNDDCLSDCNPAYCGDGVVWATGNGTEKCDKGLGNSDILPNICRKDCTLPRCGDGVLDRGEQCDGSNFKDYKDGLNQCENFALMFENGNLECDECKITTSSCGEVVRGLKLNGKNESIDISNLILEKGEKYTLSAWILPEEKLRDSGSIIGCTNSILYLNTEDSGFAFGMISDSHKEKKATATSGLDVGKLVHVAGVQDNYNLNIYVNGVRQDFKSYIGGFNKSVECMIGAHKSGNTLHFKGIIDEVRIYDKPLGKQEILQLYKEREIANVSMENLIGWWTFNEGEGKVANDISKNGYSGKILGNPEWVVRSLN